MIALLSIIAVAGAIGIVVSFGQRPPAQATHPSPGPVARQPITPSPVPIVPQSGFGFSVADDLATRTIVLFGGVGDYPNTWLWDGSRWTLAHPQASPLGRFGAAEAYDPQTKMVMLFGGRLEPGTPVHDTWAWNGTTWGALDSGASGPPPGEGSDMAWDPATNQMVLLTRSGVISSPAATWIWAGKPVDQTGGRVAPGRRHLQPDGVRSTDQFAAGDWVLVWDHRPPPVRSTQPGDGTAPPGHCCRPRATPPFDGSTMALDPAIGRLVLCACDAAAKADLTAWNGGRWDPLLGSRLPVAGGVEITDYDRSRLLLFASGTSQPLTGQAPVELWQLTGSSWRRLGPAA